MARTLGELAGLPSSSFATSSPGEAVTVARPVPLTPYDQVAETIASDARLPDAGPTPETLDGTSTREPQPPSSMPTVAVALAAARLMLGLPVGAMLWLAQRHAHAPDTAVTAAPPPGSTPAAATGAATAPQAEAAPAKPALAGTTPPAPSTSSAPPVAPETPAKKGNTLAYVGLGVGAVGLAFGTVAGVLSLSKTSSAKEHCTGDRCSSTRGRTSTPRCCSRTSRTSGRGGHRGRGYLRGLCSRPTRRRPPRHAPASAARASASVAPAWQERSEMRLRTIRVAFFLAAVVAAGGCQLVSGASSLDIIDDAGTAHGDDAGRTDATRRDARSLGRAELRRALRDEGEVLRRGLQTDPHGPEHQGRRVHRRHRLDLLSGPPTESYTACSNSPIPGAERFFKCCCR